MTVEDLLKRLRPSGDLISQELYVLKPNVETTFIAPPLHEIETASSPRVVLISAPAAVGKTTLANYVARESEALLWDLSRLRLGDAVLIGSLGRAYGYGMLGSLVERLASGDVSIVLDGLDEAYVRSGVEGLEALAADVQEILGDSPETAESTSFLIFGRSTAIDLFSIALEYKGVLPNHLRIGFFDGEAASSLIDAQAGAAVLKPGYVATRERLIESIRASIRVVDSPDEEDENAFLGYAPVLNALGRYLSDPDDVAAALSDQAAQGGAFWDQLARVSQDILEREQRKVRGQLDAPARVSPEYFSPEHQIQMLLAAQPISLIDAGWTAEDEEVRRNATEAARAALDGHPFISADRLGEPLMRRFVNTVFRDFLIADALRSEDLDSFVSIMDAFWKGDYAPSSLTAFFYLRPDEDGRATTNVDPELLSLLQSSLTAEALSREEPVSLVLTEQDGSIAVSVGRRGLAETLDFSFPSPRPLILSTPLSHCSINLTDIPVSITPIGEEIALGPRLTIRAPRIDLDGSRLWIDANDSDAVLLSAAQVNALAAHMVVRLSRDDALIVQCSTPPYPLRRFAREAPEVVPHEELRDALLELRRMLVWFESGPTGEVGYFKKPLQTAARKGRVSQDMLDYSLRVGLLRDQGKLYIARPEVVALDLFRIRRGDMDRNVEAFLRNYVAWRDSRWGAA